MIQAQVHLCQVCEKEEADRKCSECDLYTCRKCADIHLGVRPTHWFTKLEDK